jgi:hypothetical protein
MAIIFHPKKDELIRKAKVCENQSKNLLEKTRREALNYGLPSSL